MLTTKINLEVKDNIFSLLLFRKYILIIIYGIININKRFERLRIYN